MTQFLILAQSAVGGKALAAWCRLLCTPDADETLEGDRMIGVPIVFDERIHRLDSVVAIYRYLVGRIESCVSTSDKGLCESQVTVLVDSVRPMDLAVVEENASWDNLVSMLILTFPEFRWAFAYAGIQRERNRSTSDRFAFPAAVDLNTEPDKVKEIQEHVFLLHDRYSLFRHWADPLFDPSGLREWIRLQTNADLQQMSFKAGNQNTPFQLPRRRELAAVIEDERDYGVLHGYAAYRFGFRTDVVTSWRQMAERFHAGSPQNLSVDETPAELTEAEKHKYRLILEDMRLQFPDKSAKTHLSELDERGIHCNRLADKNDDSDFRFMISTGQESDADDLWNLNDSFLDNKRAGVGRLLPKPVGGPLELWRTTRLTALLEDGVADGFVSPPAEIMDDLYDGHGAPGKLALVARTLIERSRKVLADADTPQKFILSAVLANDAFELLGGKTPTMSLEAIKLKHVAEIRAECSFMGVGFHVELDDRIREIDRFVKSVCRWYQPSERQWVGWDAKATIYNELVKIYRDAGHMEEEDQCLREFRWYNRRLELARSVSRVRPFRAASHGVLWYAEFLLGSPTRIVFSIATWWLLFVLIQRWMDVAPVNPIFYLALQLNWMVGGGAYDYTDLKPGEEAVWGVAMITVCANIIGVFHFGVLMSYLYGLISRK